MELEEDEEQADPSLIGATGTATKLKFSVQLQTVTGVLQSVETTTINHEMEVKLGILANRLLHGSYWFLILDMMFRTKFDSW